MHILLTDILTCPVCGPQYGLILRADRLSDRRVDDGALGCPNCRRNFPIEEGIADLALESGVKAVEASAGGPAGIESVLAAGHGAADDAMAIRIAALLGLDRGTGFAMILGPAAACAARIPALAGDYEIVADAQYSTGAHGVSRIHAGTTIPLVAGRLRGLWLSGSYTNMSMDIASRALHPLGRLVLEPAPANAADAMAASGMRIVAQQEETLVAART